MDPLRSSRLHSLRLRFMLAAIACAALFSALAGGLAYVLGHQRAYASSLTAIDSLVQAVDKTLAVGAFAGDRVLLQEVSDGLARHALVAGVEVLGADGARLAAHWNAGRPAPAGADGAAAARSDSASLTIVHPLASPFDPKETVGVLRIHADAARVGASASRQALALSGLMVGQAVLVALLLYAMASGLVTKPIVRLAHQLRRMEAGTDQRLPTPPQHRQDEIGMLITGANDLLQANAQALQTERRLRAEIELMEAQYRQIFDASSAGIFVIDEQGRLINGNPKVLNIVGLSLQTMRELAGDSFLQRVFAQPARVQSMIDAARQSGRTVSADLELLQRQTGSRWVHCLISVQEATPGPLPGAAPQTLSPLAALLVEGVIYDITERRQAEVAARHQADHDALTGLASRRATVSRLDGLLAAALAAGTPLAVLSLDLDGFKQVNDQLGHNAGDEVLRACGQRFKAATRQDADLVGRLGGDEFLIALPGLGPGDQALAQLAETLLQRLAEPIPLQDGRQAMVGVSIGIACLPLHGLNRLQLTEAADRALYMVKRHGKRRYAMALRPDGAEAPAAGAAPELLEPVPA